MSAERDAVRSLASMYEAMAERIRAGEAEATVLADYGLMRAAHPWERAIPQPSETPTPPGEEL